MDRGRRGGRRICALRIPKKWQRSNLYSTNLLKWCFFFLSFIASPPTSRSASSSSSPFLSKPPIFLRFFLFFVFFWALFCLRFHHVVLLIVVVFFCIVYWCPDRWAGSKVIDIFIFVCKQWWRCLILCVCNPWVCDPPNFSGFDSLL